MDLLCSFATPSSREARLTVEPMAVNSNRRGSPTAPMMAGPAWIPIANSRSCIPSSRRAAFQSVVAARILRPVANACLAACVTSLCSPNTSKAPSPTNLSTIPSFSNVASVTNKRKWLSKAAVSRGEICSASVVNPRMSTKSTARSRSCPCRKLSISSSLMASEISLGMKRLRFSAVSVSRATRSTKRLDL